MNRWIGIVCLALCLSVNTALFLRDILPRWTAGDPPAPPASALRINEERRTQLAIYNESGNLIGRSWTIASRTVEALAVRTRTKLNPILVPGHPLTPDLTIQSDFFYDNQLRLSDLNVNVGGLGFPIGLRGEYVPPEALSCEWQFDAHRGRFILEGPATRALLDVTRPFDELTGLEVGQSWSVQVFNPLTGLLSGLNGAEMQMEPVYFRVTRQELVEHRGQRVECHVVEGERIQAWIAPGGRAIRQMVTMPLLGVLTLVDEPFSQDLFHGTALD